MVADRVHEDEEGRERVRAAEGVQAVVEVGLRAGRIS